MGEIREFYHPLPWPQARESIDLLMAGPDIMTEQTANVWASYMALALREITRLNDRNAHLESDHGNVVALAHYWHNEYVAESRRIDRVEALADNWEREGGNRPASLLRRHANTIRRALASGTAEDGPSLAPQASEDPGRSRRPRIPPKIPKEAPMLDLPVWGPSPQEAEIAALKARIARLAARVAELTRDVEVYRDAQAVAAGELHDVAEVLGCHAEDAVERARVLRALLAEAREVLEPFAALTDEDGEPRNGRRVLGVCVEVRPQDVVRARALLARLTADNERPSECEGQGACHGALKWCSACGDVSRTCDAVECDVHPASRLTPKEALPCICSWCQESIPSGVVCDSCKDGLNGPQAPTPESETP